MTEQSEDKIKVIVAADFSEALLERLQSVSEKLDIQKYFPNVPESAYTDAEILYTIRHFPTPAQAPKLKWIQVHFAGVDGVIDRPIVKKEGLQLTSANGVHVPQMPEYCLAMMLHFMYKIQDMITFKAQSQWPQAQYEIFNPHSLHGLTLGIAGYGTIGRELARIAAAMGMTVLATKRDVMHPEADGVYTPEGMGDPDGDIPERLYPSEAIGSMAEECDFLVITVPLTDATRNMVDAPVFERMKPNAILINVSRGGVVDEAALIGALEKGKIAGAAMDVFEQEPLPSDSPLWQIKNLVISPHVSGNTVNYHEKVVDLFTINLERYLANRSLLNLVQRQRGY